MSTVDGHPLLLIPVVSQCRARLPPEVTRDVRPSWSGEDSSFVQETAPTKDLESLPVSTL